MAIALASLSGIGKVRLDERGTIMATLTHNLFWGQGERDYQLGVVEGTWPNDIDGGVFIVGPDKRKPGGHWFAEHGIVCKIHCVTGSDGKIPVQMKLVDTPLKRIRERLPQLFGKVFVMEASPFGVTNLGNTNVQPMNERLFLGYDVGRPLEIDPETLEFITPVGSNSEWVQGLPGLLEPMVSVAAHPAPAFDEKCIYFVNYTMMPMEGGESGTWVARWDLEGPVRRWKLEGMSRFDSIHDIKATRDYLVITDLPFVSEAQTFRGKPRTRPAQDFTQLWIIRKSDLKNTPEGGAVRVKELRIPMATGHIAIDYENPDGVIQVYLQHIPTVDLAISINEKERDRDGKVMDRNFEGMPGLGFQPSAIGRYRIAAETGELLEKKLAVDKDNFWGGVLWTQNLYTADSQNRAQNLYYGAMGFDPELITETEWRLYRDSPSNIVPSEELPRQYVPGALARIDLEKMKYVDIYRYDSGTFPHPPTFVPRKNCKGDTDGYVVVIVHKNGPKEVHVFDAGNLKNGPVARATAPDFNPPLLLHSCWMPPRKGPRNSGYKVDPIRDVVGAIRHYPARAANAISFFRLMAKGAKAARKKMPAGV